MSENQAIPLPAIEKAEPKIPVIGVFIPCDLGDNAGQPAALDGFDICVVIHALGCQAEVH